MGRRIVRLSYTWDGPRHYITCEAIPLCSSTLGDIVISCIRWPHTNTFWFTSDELIAVLEQLLQISFSEMLKDEIVEDLSVFHPAKISMEAAGTHMFYKRVASYTSPRVIILRSQLEVLPWDALAAVLVRVLARFDCDKV